MRIETNKKLVKRNSQLSNYLFFATMAVLIGGFLITNGWLFNDTLGALSILLAPLLLVLGLVMTVVSVRMTNLWARTPRPEDALEEGLKGLSNNSVLYNYYHFPSRHVLICPQGVFAIVTPWQAGRHTVEGSRWKAHYSLPGRIMATLRFDAIGNPMDKATKQAEHVKKLLTQIGVEDVEVQPLVVMVDEKAEIEQNEPAVPVLFAFKKKPNLRDYLRDLKRQQQGEESSTSKGKKKQAGRENTLPLTDEQIEAFEAATLKR
ncbi:MAG: NERD domain-containing protein [Chloroflexi bacterium]|nr:MAG: NERD domain-containing protein [Chloroflexota bacterium]